MVAPQDQGAKTSSRCTPGTARATHAFEIVGYSLHKGLGSGKCICSATFSVDGHEWRILYYPDGYTKEDNEEYVSVFVQLIGDGEGGEVRALLDLRLVEEASGLSMSVVSKGSPITFKAGTIRGYPKFKKRSELEASPYLRDDRLVIECEITVIKEARVMQTSPVFQAMVPLSDLSGNLAELLEAQDEADVIFKVKGETFPAHKIILAMRSPVFKAQFYGPMKDKRMRNVTVEDIQPAVFKGLVHFIYTDSLPSMDDLDDGEYDEMVKHLLVAADRYAVESMKMLCEGILCKNLDVESVATTLGLADQYHCSMLKDACVEFIISSDRMKDVLVTEGYVHLKKSRPAVLVDMFEKLTLLHNI
ncbi:BTB/POZ and MATH domain-containing protein 1-like [Lolium perenne]|uniref:BTB/POZ and MATH domain-containing protein 1-like n=1 Tax=Lolium perenne TaxID=4522 RepID=UPI0021F5DD21|nr:BTB/POZ and MATH domain-containing protein 1-like [Lolium perenne]